MNTRILGRTGISVSEISFGGVEIGLPYGIGIKTPADMPTEGEAINLLHTALDRGINYFDTARLYGRSEEIIGQAFHGKRSQVVICSKCSHLPKINAELPDSITLKNFINQSFQASLQALRTDYIDVYLLHNTALADLHHPAIPEAFSALKENGSVRAIGVSTYSLAETQLAIEQDVWDVIQLSFNLMDQRQLALFEPAQAAGVGLMVRSVLLKGILSDRGRNLHPALKIVADHRNRYQELLNENSPTISMLATQFALSFSEVSTVLVGIDRLEYLEQAVATANGRYLDAASLARAKALAFPDPEFLNLPQWDREGKLK
jgi:aryl-alcohol dehydrogenase-like predicted oxidoreductase